MMKLNTDLKMLLPLFIVYSLLSPCSATDYFQPEQIHLSYGENVYDIVVTWTTYSDCKSSVEYGIEHIALKAHGNTTKFIDGGSERRVMYIHRVLLSNLTSSSKYVYHCGSDLGWSGVFWFLTPPDESKWSPHLAIYGDMGNENAQSLARLQEEVQRSVYDAIIHVGDFAYDMDSDNARVGDEFMRQIETVAAYVPYMTCPGNHEQTYNFSNYRARFSMPGESEGLWYSFDMGPVHFVALSTEVYYNFNYGMKQLVKQYYWLEEDLKKASEPENRKKHPWIITYGHRPMYCSNYDFDDCRQHSTFVRSGIPVLKWFGLEEMFYRYGVDLSIWAHEHSYERLWPVYDYKVLNGSVNQPYQNPRATVHIITGSAGCSERTDPFIPNKPEWSAFRNSDYGYTKVKAWNDTHLYVEQVSDDQDGKVIDNIWLVKDKHEAFNNLK
ncbi:acid phosphatase type 7 [Frankliniella occidentalis]|uniref:Purple acid phosphatase n=1 Tax=Frankliniella occidentalis TaxID=133901 RepID=A0A6J1T7L5_FRAOC|nr:acid phosphatase type 7 [Frankliniella occidentalis]